MPNLREHNTASVAEIRACFAAGLTKRETADHLRISLSGLRQACSLLVDLQVDVANDYGQRSIQVHRKQSARLQAHNPFGINHAA